MKPYRQRLLASCAAVGLAFALVGPAMAQSEAADREAMMKRIELLEKRINELEAKDHAAAAAPPAAAAPAPMASMPGMKMPMASAPVADTPVADTPRSDRLAVVEQRLDDLESNVVLSEPKTTVKRIQVWIDKDGTEYDHEVPGAKPSMSYQRTTASRRQAISEEIEEALAGENEKRVQIGVSSTFTVQNAQQTSGIKSVADGHSYSLASADITFTAPLAQNTYFFADVVGLTGTPPDTEIGGLTLLNGYSARLSRAQELNLREAWVSTALFNQSLNITAGRLDLTNYFDRNAAANDENRQFLSDALVNSPALGLSSNGQGVAVVYQPYNGLSIRAGAQQSDPLATNLSESIYALAEIGYIARPFGLPEGNYRVWVRTDNSTPTRSDAWGVSIDQKLTPSITLFGRYGTGKVGLDDVDFASGGFQFQGRYVFNPLDNWGLGYARTELAANSENLVEAYYSLHLTEKLRVSPHLQWVEEDNGVTKRAFILPGLRLQASF